MNDFNRTVQRLMFDFSLISENPSKEIELLKKNSQIQFCNSGYDGWSLNEQLFMNTKEKINSSFFLFNFKKVPVIEKHVDSGYFRIVIAKSNVEEKVTNYEWVILIKEYEYANVIYNMLINTFKILTKKYNIHENEKQSDIISYAEFEVEKRIENEFSGITFLIGKSTGGYEIIIKVFL